MLISDMIAQLQAIKDEYGDLPLKMCWDDFHWSFNTTLDVNDVWQVAPLNGHVLIMPTSGGSYTVDYA